MYGHKGGNVGPQFFQTIMGKQFFEGQLPELIRQLKKLNKNLEKLTEQRREDDLIKSWEE